MTAYAALLRAVNVGGTGKLAMSDLRAICEAAGFDAVSTYIQSGNVVFRSRLGEASVKRALEPALERKVGKPVRTLIRTAKELAAIDEGNPFEKAEPKSVLVLFLDEAPPSKFLASVVVPGDEEIAIRGRELFVHFPSGQGKSKLKIPLQNAGTGRNLNTLRKLIEMTRALG